MLWVMVAWAALYVLVPLGLLLWLIHRHDNNRR